MVTATQYRTDADEINKASPHSVINLKCRSSSDRYCSCNRRFTCDICRSKWIRKRTKSRLKSLTQHLPRDYREFFATLSISTSDQWAEESTRLLKLWGEVCRERTRDLKRVHPTGLDEIIRGVASLHWFNGTIGHWQAHLHCVLITTPAFEPHSLYNFWQQAGGSYADVKPVKKTLGHAIGYSIGGDLPPDPADRARLQAFTHGQHLVRSIGK